MKQLTLILVSALFIAVSCGKTNPEDAGAVDLGLSVKWATCNLGAAESHNPGTYFAFGDILGQTWDGTKWSGTGFYTAPTCELDAIGNLLPKYDAASVKLGGKWRMPSKDNLNELIGNCKREWVTDYKGTGVAGVVFTSKMPGFTDKSIFIPASGQGYKDGLRLPKTNATLWTAANVKSDGNPSCLYGSSSTIEKATSDAFNGYPIRPVYPKE